MLRRLYLGTGRNVAAKTDEEEDEDDVFDVAIVGDEVDEMDVTQELFERLDRPYDDGEVYEALEVVQQLSNEGLLATYGGGGGGRRIEETGDPVAVCKRPPVGLTPLRLLTLEPVTVVVIEWFMVRPDEVDA